MGTVEELSLRLGEEERFHPIVKRLREPRSPLHGLRLQLLNALVSGCDEMGGRVALREELLSLEFIEITRALMSREEYDGEEGHACIHHFV